MPSGLAIDDNGEHSPKHEHERPRYSLNALFGQGTP